MKNCIQRWIIDPNSVVARGAFLSLSSPLFSSTVSFASLAAFMDYMTGFLPINFRPRWDIARKLMKHPLHSIWFLMLNEKVKSGANKSNREKNRTVTKMCFTWKHCTATFFLFIRFTHRIFESETHPHRVHVALKSTRAIALLTLVRRFREFVSHTQAQHLDKIHKTSAHTHNAILSKRVPMQSANRYANESKQQNGRKTENRREKRKKKTNQTDCLAHSSIHNPMC